MADGDQSLMLDGGEGDDYVLTVLGEKAITVGGPGRDWIFNTSHKGDIYGGILLQEGEAPRSIAEHDRLQGGNPNLPGWGDVADYVQLIVNPRCGPNSVVTAFPVVNP